MNILPKMVCELSRARKRKNLGTLPSFGMEIDPDILTKRWKAFVQIPSDNCQFNEKPLMKAREITAAGKEAMLSGKYDVVRVNYANPDMVGHTGDLAATISACEESDACLKELLDLVDELGGVFLVTADHGNADDMVQRSKRRSA